MDGEERKFPHKKRAKEHLNSLTGLTYVLAAIAIMLRYKNSCDVGMKYYDGSRLCVVAAF